MPKPHLKLAGGQMVEVPLPDRLAKPRARFGGRLFAHEEGTDWERDAEPVLTRHARKADWRNTKGRNKA